MTAFQRLAIGLALFCASAPVRADYIDHFASRTDVGRFKVPSQGTTRILVIPVFVDDQRYSAGSEAAFRAELEDFFAVDDRSVFDGGFRFTAYWEQASLGRFRPEAVVADPVHFPSCPRLGAHEDCRIPRGGGVADGDLAGAAATLRDSLRFLDEIILCATAGTSVERRCTSGGGVDLADFDTSGQQPGVADGFVDGVLVVSNASFPGIALPVKDLSGQQLLTFLGPLPSFTYGDITVPSVGIAGFASAPQRETFVAVHEFGHLLGFADLYNEAGTTTDLPYTVMGGWYYDTPAVLLDPFSRLAIGWANVVDVSGGGTFRIDNATRSGQVLKVGSGEEFFLIEHRAAGDTIEGDIDVDSGVFIERVRLSRRPAGAAGNYLQTLQECVNCRPLDSLLTVEEADGAYDLQRNRARNDAADLFQAGQAMAPSDDTEPRNAGNLVFSTNLFSGEATGLTITVDASDSDGATITVSGPAKEDPCADLDALCLQDCVVDDEGHGRCGDFATFPPPPPPASDDDVIGCTCAGTSTMAPLLPAVLGLLWRRRRR
jgi:M6 family metalloprotease-like protein/uncharacterized protein (TIGR03382 family)